MIKSFILVIKKEETDVFEISVERLTETPRRGSKEKLKLSIQGGKSATKVILFSCTGRERSVTVFGEEVHSSRSEQTRRSPKEGINRKSLEYICRYRKSQCKLL